MQIGSIPGTDGFMRPAYRTDGCRQFVLDDDGEPVYGVKELEAALEK
jgi:hypothetical protein